MNIFSLIVGLTKDSMLFRNKITLSIILTCLLFALTYILFGYHYGWLDDVLQNNYFRGIPLSKPIDYFYTVQIGFSKLYNRLYLQFPDIPWYGISLGVWIFLATINFFIFLLYCFEEIFKRFKWLALILLIGTYFTVWVENVYLINFSRVAILLMGTSFLNIDRIIKAGLSTRKNICGLIYFSVTFLAGVLTRHEISLIILPFLIIYSFLKFHDKWDVVKVLGTIALLLILFKVIDYSQYAKDVDTKRSAVSHIINLTDGLNTYNSDFDSLWKSNINFRAIALCYFPDSSFIGKDVLNSIGPDSPFSWITIRNIGNNLFTEYDKARYEFEVYHRPMNWFWKSTAFAFFNLLLLFLSFRRFKRNEISVRSIALQSLLSCTFFSTVFAVTVLTKMEDRILNPSFIIFTASHLAVWSDQNRTWIKVWSLKKMVIFILIPLLVLTIFRINGYITISMEKKKELRLKKIFLNELNNDFRGKMIFYDQWTMTLLHQSPLQVIHLNPENIHTSYGEYWCNFMPEHQKYLERLCGKTDFISFYKCLYRQRDKIVFIFSEIDRKQFLEEYAQKIYGEKLRFKEINPNSALNTIHYSFLPYYYDFGYYVFDYSFSDAPGNTDIP